MSRPFEIDTDALGRAEAPFRELAQRLVALSQQVQADVRGLGAVWGDDRSGKEFAAQYGPARDDLLEALRSTGDVVTSTADGVRTMAQGFQRTEESNREASSALLRRTQAESGLPADGTVAGTHVDAGQAASVRRAVVAAEPGVPVERALRREAAHMVTGEPAGRAEPGVAAEPLRAAGRLVAGAPDAVLHSPEIAGRAEADGPAES